MILTTAGTDPIVSLIGNWSAEINVWSILLRILLAALVGGIMGAERASKHHFAGLRTYILVCVGACAVTFTNVYVAYLAKEIGVNADISRIAAGVVGGVGFLGAGSIIVTSRKQVRGLTTAAALWASGCVGISIGFGFYTLSIVAAIVIFITLIFLPKLETKLQSKSKLVDIHVELLSRPDLKSLLDFVRRNNVQVLSISYDPAYANTGLSVYSIALKINKNKDKKYMSHDVLLNSLKSLEYVNYVEYID